MGRRGPLPCPKHDVIAGSNLDLLRRLGIPPVQAMYTCWACRARTKSPYNRAHVVATSHGGSMDPRNFFLLCDHCHLEQPDGAPREVQEEWLLNAPGLWEWAGSIVETMRKRVERAAERLGRPQSDVARFFGELDWNGMEDAISGGYRSTAGLFNGRANAMANVVALFEKWATALEAPVAQQGTPTLADHLGGNLSPEHRAVSPEDAAGNGAAGCFEGSGALLQDREKGGGRC